MKRRTLIGAIGATTVGSAAATGTGAFFDAEVDRSVSATVTTDEDAFLSIESVNDEYTESNADGELVLNFSGNSEGDGVAPNSKYKFSTGTPGLFSVRNQGTQEVELSFEGPDDYDNPTLEDDDISWGLFAPGFGPPYTLTPGDSRSFGAVIETGEDPPESASFRYKIVAEDPE
ncbi:hypothetical protein [Halorubrum ezzemoulense]|uniref:hypothetical protein n=1 Tax=Halorubrum ezzemoulense TaxID=337243 RepID=UPI00113FD103|nr:hypothetical protein [Halorubrum ezzemoulense]